MKSNDWSCSKFSDWLRGTAKLSVGTSEEWMAWEKSAKAKKIRYWLAEEFLDYLQRIVCWPLYCIGSVRRYINNRFVVKTHALTSTLSRGEWHDFDTRLLHSIFDELVNFVEIEQAWMLVVFSAEERKKYKAPWYRTFLRMGSWRCPEAGVAYLNWAAMLKNDEDWVDKNSPEFGQPTLQALAAQEILVLYQWWKYQRQERLDPSEASGWSNYCEENRKAAEIQGDDSLVNGFILNRKDAECSGKILAIYHEMEKKHAEEDTAMLIRLIKIRQSLWT